MSPIFFVIEFYVDQMTFRSPRFGLTIRESETRKGGTVASGTAL